MKDLILLACIFAAAIILTCFIYVKKNKEMWEKSSKIDKAGIITNIILFFLYIPFSNFNFLLLMASEGTIGATNQLYITLIDIFCWITMSIPVLCIAGLILSVILRKKRKSIISFIVQFIPIMVFLLNIGFLEFIEKFITKYIQK
ncbi:MAG: hypothetical protein IKL42_05655 [Clostridia bacterium]|nr:hypothetical protein [Clostridia bacterium]MBR3576869.1 hypothetical protein [Clostridia bacterium]